ncbi:MULTISPECIES: SMI1/KNR4 family protein [unclassified Streptomyces]|uniref:SMI1/KNR4 family protein n=1 Tax=unclassified Streptomyces TaxID=2593676 RepID=UPI00386EF17A|nr:SMI1/KNR4 family protein [Streptomyces sp. NBC_00827]
MARFEDLCRSLWDTSSEHAVQPPLTDRAIAETQRLLDVTLPSSLLDLLSHQNGGVVATGRDAFPTSRPTSWSADHVPFDFVMGIGHREHTLSILDSPYLVEEWGLPTAVVLVSVSAPCFIGLDYRAGGRDGEPAVAWFDADLRTELTLAPDFRSFIEGLASARDFEGMDAEETPD